MRMLLINLRHQLIKALQFIHRHTHALDGLKEKLGLQRIVTNAVVSSFNRGGISCVLKTVKTDVVTNRILELRNMGIDDPDIYILAAESMGDVLSCEPIGRYLKKFAPCSHIHWIVRTSFRDVISYAPFIDEVITVETLSEGYDILCGQERNGKSVVVNCHMDGTSCAKTKRIIRNPVNPNINFYTYYHVGTLLNSFSLAAGLPKLDWGSEFYFNERVVLPFPVPSGSVVVHCRSTDPLRDWTTEKWNQLATRLCATGHTVIEIGFPRTIETDSDKYIDFTGIRSIQEVARIIQSASLFVSIDSGFAHVACATKTPSVVLLGKYAHYDTYMPYSGDFAHSPKMRIVRAAAEEYASAITVDQVLACM